MIRSVLGSRASIGGVLGSGRGGAAAAWYLAGGVSAANCVAAYQPIGAVSLAASYDNIAAPGNGLADGTYDAAPGVAPTWAAATGWAFAAASSQYLTTGVVPSSGWSAIVRFSDASGAGAAFGSIRVNGTIDRFYLYPSNGSAVGYGNGTGVNVAPPMTNGTLAIAGVYGYRNGVQDTASIAAWAAAGSVSIYIGARHGNTETISFFSGKIQALAIYNTTLTGTQIGLISAAMAAL